MASLGGAGESAAAVVGAGERGSATATLLAGAGLTVVAVDRTPKALDELPEGIRREVGDTTDQAVAKTLIDPAAYGLSKAALSHLVRILDLELRPQGIGPQGIGMNEVAPQLLDTSTNRAGHPGGGAGTRCPAGSGRGHHRLPRQDRAAPVSGAVVPAHGAEPGRITPCHPCI
jgi:NAD(P)-dependent dehydrogenase (short-subunit alcohol dehydrogenase family)